MTLSYRFSCGTFDILGLQFVHHISHSETLSHGISGF
jgi:hypothetical protein